MNVPLRNTKLVEAANARDGIATEARERLADCQNQKSPIRTDIEECYFFAAPQRIRSSVTTSPGAGHQRSEDRFELQTSAGYEISDEFANMAISSFTPAESPWAERKPGALSNQSESSRIEALAREQDKRVFELIRASNFHAELGKTAVPDLSIGALGMLILDRHPALPIVCQGIPIREIEINLGPDGRIDDRFIVRNSKYRHVKAQLRGVTLPPDLETKIKDNPDQKCQIKWGWWRNWENVGDEEWQHVVLVDDELVHDATLTGEGSCPFTFGRFGATPDSAWAYGPLIKSLPELRQLDELCAAMVEHIDFMLRPPKAYEDDGVLNLSGGIEPGMAYPKRPNGGREVFEDIYRPQQIDAAVYDEQKIIKRIRRLHYVDFPEQRGKTPPSATQWLDEMVIQQQRIGTPGYSYWREFPFEVFQRFRYLGETRGTVKKVEQGGVSLAPQNPAQRAHENQKVQTALRLLQAAGSVFPQTLPVAVDDMQTIANLKLAMGDEIVKMRDQEEIAQAVQNVSQLAGVFGPRPQGGVAAAAQSDV